MDVAGSLTANREEGDGGEPATIPAGRRACAPHGGAVPGAGERLLSGLEISQIISSVVPNFISVLPEWMSCWNSQEWKELMTSL